MAKFIVITSGKGGVGKSTTAVNLATAMSSLDEDVTLIDANLTTPNIGLHLGAPVVPTALNHVISGKAHLAEAIYEHESGTKVIPSSLSIKDFKKFNGRDLASIAKELREVSDIVILDSAAGLGSETLTVMSLADEIILVTNPEMPAVADALKTAKIAEGMGKDVKGVIVTRLSGSRYEMSLQSIKEMLELPIIGVVPEDPNIKEALALRNAIVLTHPRSKAARSYKAIAAKLLDKKIEKESFWDKVFYKLGFVK